MKTKMKTINYKIENKMKTIVVTFLIILASFSGISKIENLNREAIEIVENESTLQIENWMNNDNYWKGNNDQKQELTIDSWTKTSNTENIEELPALTIENWMNSNNYWNGNINEDQEFAIKIESWMTNNAYWTGSETLTLNE